MLNRLQKWGNYDIDDIYNFPTSKSWFGDSELKTNIIYGFPKYKTYNILEIGSYEGCSSCCMSDLLLSNNDSKMICVDPFMTDDKSTPVFEHTIRIFYNNIDKSLNREKIRVEEKYSDDFFKDYTGDKFNFIYIDGAHNDEQIYKDLDNSLKVLEKEGLVWCDDYDTFWKETFLRWLKNNDEKVKILHTGYQLGFTTK